MGWVYIAFSVSKFNHLFFFISSLLLLKCVVIWYFVFMAAGSLLSESV